MFELTPGQVHRIHNDKLIVRLIKEELEYGPTWKAEILESTISGYTVHEVSHFLSGRFNENTLYNEYMLKKVIASL